MAKNTNSYPSYEDEQPRKGKVYPMWSMTIFFFGLSIFLIRYLLLSSGFAWLFFLLLLIFSVTNFLFFLTHKLAVLPDKTFYALYNELSRFSRFIGDGPTFIRRTQHVDTNKPVVRSEVFESNLRKITNVYDSMGFSADAPLLVWYYVDYSRMPIPQQRKILISASESGKLNSISSAYVHRMVQSLIFNLQQDQLAGPDAAYAIDTYFKEIFYPERSWSPLSFVSDMRAEERNPWGLVLVEYTGTPAPGKVLVTDRDKALSSTFRALQTLRVSDDKKIPLETMMQANAASSPYARSSYRLYGSANLPSIPRAAAAAAAKSNAEIDDAEFVTNEQVSKEIPAAAQAMYQSREQTVSNARLRDSRNIQQMREGVGRAISAIGVNLAGLGALGVSVFREGLTALVNWSGSLVNSARSTTTQATDQTISDDTEVADNIIFVTVQPGDTFEQLEKKYGTSRSEIIRINQLDANQSLILGQLLRIPDNVMARSAARLSAASFIRNSTRAKTHVEKVAPSTSDDDGQNERIGRASSFLTDDLEKGE